MLVASQLVFVHIPRTGGAFIKGVLRDHLDQDTRVPRLPAHASYDEIPRSGKPQPPRRRSSLTSVENGQAGVVPGD
jgi:hypothetical protein